MTRKEYKKLTNELLTRAMALSESKSKDYATADILSNFKRLSGVIRTLDLCLDTPTNYSLSMSILKIDRIVNLLKQGGVPQNEPIDDSFIDCINYLLLAYAGWKEGKKGIFSIDKDDPNYPKYIVGDDGDLEWVCKHGVGHSKNVHTCDGCCNIAKNKNIKKATGK